MKRRWIFWLLVVLFLWLVISRLSEIKKLAATLSEGQWQWVALAALLQVGYYIVYSAIYQAAFQTVGVTSRIRELLPVTFASIFVNVAAPSGGASGVALFVDDASRRGQSAARAAIGTLLVLVADFSAFLVLLVGGLVFLFTHHALKYYEIIAAVILLAIIGGLTGFLLLGLWRPQWLHALLGWARKQANRLAGFFKRPELLDEAWVEKNEAEFSEAAIAIAANPGLVLRTLGIAAAAHILDLSTLFVLFLAFHQKVHFGVLVAGYAMGVLFWIVAITPQGIGVVEGMMTLVFASLGVPIERATVIALAFRGLTFWLPLAIGFLVMRRVKSFGMQESARSEAWGVRLVALLTAGMGIIDVLSGLTPSLHDRLQVLEKYSPFGVGIGGHLTSVLAGFALLVLGNGLWRRKRLAWGLAILVLLVSVPIHIFKGLDYEEAALGAVLAVWLIYQGAHFHARSDTPSIRQGLLTLLAALAFSLVYGVLGFYLLDRHFIVHGQRISFDLWGAIRQTVTMFTQFYNPGVEPATHFGRNFVNSIYVVSAATTGYALLMLIRPVLVRKGPSIEEKKRAREIIEAHGHSSLARLLLLDDKQYYFSPGGSVIGYVVEGRIALTLGDPVGPQADLEPCIASFKTLCDHNDWEPAYYQVLPATLQAYEAAGYSALCIGNEAIVDLATFSLAGGDKKGIRSGVNKLTKLGFRAEMLQPPLSQLQMDELRQVSDEWLTSMNGSEKRFSLGWFDEAYLNSGPVMVIRHPQGYVDAFVNILPEYQANEVTIDLMRHRQAAERGQMDFLFVSLFEWAKSQGYATFNLGLSSLSGVGENPTDPAIERALHYVYEHVNQFYNFKGLHEFKAKYDPTWSPRYLIYPSPASLPAVTIAMLRADSGNEFLGGYLKRRK